MLTSTNTTTSRIVKYLSIGQDSLENIMAVINITDDKHGRSVNNI